MKTLYILGLSVSIFSVVNGQVAKAVNVASVNGEQRLALAKESIEVTEWHHDSFWRQYENYLQSDQEVTGTEYSALSGLAEIHDLSADQQAYQNGVDVIRYRYEQLSLWQKYYAQMAADHNGVIALQFLQTEVLLDMLESSRIYEQTSLGKYRSYPVLDSATQKPLAMHRVVQEALSLSDEVAPVFFRVFDRYQQERDDLLGEEYDQLAVYAGNPSDYSPAQAKAAGSNLLEVVKREIRLKEKYFGEMNLQAGPLAAARFLAWEDYYSLVCKMDSWLEAK